MIHRRSPRRRWAWALPLVAGCTPVDSVQPAPGPVPRDPATVADTTANLPPAGFGSLRQDEFSVDLSDASLHLKVTPLTEEVIRLAAPDTYDRLRALGASRTGEAGRMTEGRGGELFLVSFFSREANVEYRPEELQLGHRGRSLRPAGIMPLTTGWGRQLLQPQQTQSAIYVFESPFDYELPITLRYGVLQNDEWQRTIIPRLQEERARVTSRAGGWSR
jgi:hypothetical protein